VIFITVVLPFALAALVRRTKSQRIERVIVAALSAVLILNYLAYLIFIRSRGVMDWWQMLPMQMCDWGMVVVMVAMWTGHQRWFEVAYFWGIGGTLQAVLTPNLALWFPGLAVHQFFHLTLRHYYRRNFPDADARLSTVPGFHCSRMVVVGILFRGHADR
jgi:hypothetical integral membrane protein (TIGR02206 family)